MFGELIEWLANLDPVFAFLLALPFAVALAGLLSEAVRRPRSAPEPRGRDSSATPVAHQRHVWEP
jgi:hypothetical protein